MSFMCIENMYSIYLKTNQYQNILSGTNQLQYQTFFAINNNDGKNQNNNIE